MHPSVVQFGQRDFPRLWLIGLRRPTGPLTSHKQTSIVHFKDNTTETKSNAFRIEIDVAHTPLCGSSFDDPFATVIIFAFSDDTAPKLFKVNDGNLVYWRAFFVDVFVLYLPLGAIELDRSLDLIEARFLALRTLRLPKVVGIARDDDAADRRKNRPV